MPELRWTLLILGVIFVAVLAWWERRRPHQASRQTPHIGGDSPRSSANTEPMWSSDIETANPRAVRDPTLMLPEIRVREPAPPRDLPVVEIPGDSLMGLRAADADQPDPVKEEFAKEEVEAQESDATDDAMDPILADEPVVAELDAPVAPQVAESMVAGATAPAATPVAATAHGSAIAPAPAATEKPPELPPPITNIVRPILNWPPEAERKLVSLRLVARAPERLQGRLVRQALAAEGFVLGELDIFHKPDPENRAVLSAASLTKPGTFDLETMDTQRYVGLNLFAVLPGPKSPQKAFEDLLLTARMLNERLEGALQDERGGPLTPTRIQAIRDGLGAGAKS